MTVKRRSRRRRRRRRSWELGGFWRLLLLAALPQSGRNSRGLGFEELGGGGEVVQEEEEQEEEKEEKEEEEKERVAAGLGQELANRGALTGSIYHGWVPTQRWTNIDLMMFNRMF